MKKTKWIFFGILLSITFIGFAQKNVFISKTEFKNPDKSYKPMPFWHMNGELNESEIVRQMTDAHAAGFGGLTILPVHSTTPEYLSEGYFKSYKTILETARKKDMNIILYDDTDFPSGTAGGLIERDFPQFLRKTLVKTEYDVSNVPYWKCMLPDGKLMAAVAMNMKTLERIDLTRFINNNLLSWQVPRGGDWRVMFFTCNYATFWKSSMPIDALDTAAVSQFIKLTYDKYAQRFSEYFQNTIQLTFFDDVGFLRREAIWTPNFNQKFKEVNGFSPELYYPALWYNIGTETEAARVAFFNTRSELMAEGYPKMVGEWNKKHGLKSTGHPPGNYSIQPVDMSGDIFKFYRHTDMPLTDAIIRYGRGRDGFKMISSASTVYDRPLTATEIYGAFKEEGFDSTMMYRTLMELFARGVNFVIPHGMWYNPKKVGIPPLVSPESNKLVAALPAYSNYVGRSCYLLQGGRNVADIALLYPIESLQAGYSFDAPENKVNAGEWAYKEADYQKISGLLSTEIRRDFTFVHPEYLATNQYSVVKDKIHLNNATNFQDYNLIIIPGGKVISLETLQKIQQFYNAGGKVIATTLLPTKSARFGQDSLIVSIIQDIFGKDVYTNAQLQSNAKGGKALFVPNPTKEHLLAAIDTCSPNADVIFTNNMEIKSELGVFSYCHKIKDGKDIYFFANSSDDTIKTEVLLRGKHNLELWNADNGLVKLLEKVKYIKKNGQIYSQLSLQLKPVSSIFWVEK